MLVGRACGTAHTMLYNLKPNWRHLERNGETGEIPPKGGVAWATPCLQENRCACCSRKSAGGKCGHSLRATIGPFNDGNWGEAAIMGAGITSL